MMNNQHYFENLYLLFLSGETISVNKIGYFKTESARPEHFFYYNLFLGNESNYFIKNDR
jgi:hypothetical protein